MHIHLHEIVVRQDVVQEGEAVGANALHPELRERSLQSLDHHRKVAAVRVGYHFGQQGVECRAGLIARIAEAVRTDARPARRIVGRQPATGRPDRSVFGDGLQVNPRLNGVSTRPMSADLIQTQACQGLSRRQANLSLHQVHAGDLLGHRVLHLQARVRLDEDEWRRPIAAGGIHEKLEGAEVAVALRAGKSQSRRDDGFPQAFVQSGCRRNLDQLLVAPLNAALALAEVGNVSLEITKDLHLDVTSARQKLFNVEIADAKCRLGLSLTPIVG